MRWWCINPFHSTNQTKKWRVRRWWTNLFLKPNTILLNCTLWSFCWSYELLLPSFMKQYIGSYGRATWPAVTYHIRMDCKFVSLLLFWWFSCLHMSTQTVKATFAPWAYVHEKTYELLLVTILFIILMIADIFGKAIHCTNCMTKQHAWMLHTIQLTPSLISCRKHCVSFFLFFGFAK